MPAKESIPDRVALLPNDTEGLAKLIVQASEQLAKLYSTLDLAYMLLKQHMRVGQELQIGDDIYTFQDIFADSDTAWRGKMIRRFELVKKKKRKVVASDDNTSVETPKLTLD